MPEQNQNQHAFVERYYDLRPRLRHGVKRPARWGRRVARLKTA